MSDEVSLSIETMPALKLGFCQLDEESISEHKFKFIRLLYIEGSTLGILIIFPGLEKATREFAHIIPTKKINISGNEDREVNIL